MSDYASTASRAARSIPSVEMEITGIDGYGNTESAGRDLAADLPLPQLRDGLITKLLEAGPKSWLRNRYGG